VSDTANTEKFKSTCFYTLLEREEGMIGREIENDVKYHPVVPRGG
jgi:hypothetical protein